MANIERTVSCPPQLAVEETIGGSCDSVFSAVPSTGLTPPVIRQSPNNSEMLRPVDMTELVKKLNGHRAAQSDSSPSSLGKPEEEHEEEEEEVDEDEGGAHDTITSLAGAHVLQKFSFGKIGNIRDRKFRDYKSKDLNGSVTQLENLFKEDPLLEEDEKEDQVEAESDQEDDVFVPPDGGYGWFVSLGAFMALFWTAGMVKSYGVLFAEMITLYPDNISLASWIPAVMTTTALAMAPIASALCQRFNCRYVTALGSILASLGVAVSSGMPNLQGLFVTLGILTGMGIGLATTPGIILTARYFDKKRSLANALCLSGTAAGSFSMPLLISFLLDLYGFHGTLLILGGCLLHVCISAALYRPLATHVLIIRRRERREVSQQAQTEVPAVASVQQGEKTELREEGEGGEGGERGEGGEGGEGGGERCPPESEPPLSCSLPTNTILGTPSSAHRFLADESSLAYKRSSVYSSFDSISMGSSVSQDYLEQGEGGSSAVQWSHSGRTSPTASHTPGSVVIPGVAAAKSLSLRELALHQIGSHLSLYKTMLIGSGNSIKKNVCSEGCSHEKPLVRDSKTPRRSSYMFSIEDIMVDSTAVLKDSRHPSHAHLDRGGETHRVVNLNRTQSAVGEIKTRKKSARQRFYSENNYSAASSQSSQSGLSRNSSFCQRRNQGRMELIGSSELYAASPAAQEVNKPTRKFVLQPVTIERGAEREEETAVSEGRSCDLIKTINKYIKLNLVQDPVFLVLSGSVMFMAIGVPHCLFFLPSHAKYLNLPATDASFLLSISAIFDLAGRLSLGFILDLNIFPKHYGYAVMMFISAVSAICLPSTQTFTQVAICMGFYGLGTGGWFLMVPLLLAENLGVENISSSYGLARLFQSFTNFLGPILAGSLMDLTGNPCSSFYFMGTSMSLGCIIIMFLPLAVRRSQTRTKL